MSRAERWVELDRGMDQLIATVLSMPEEQRHTPAVRGAFTPAETLEHLALTEDFYLPLVQKAAAQGIQGKAAKTTFIFPFVLRRLVSAQGVPTIKDMTPSDARPDAERAAGHWRQTRKKLKEACADIDDDATVLKHPLFGRMSPLDLVELNTAHLEYHRKRV